MYTTMPCPRLLVGVTGSVHAVQLMEYLVRFRRQFADQVRVVMTATAAQMVPPRTVELVTDGPVLTDIWGADDQLAPHVRWTRWADLFVVVPATANVLGKAANGIADDLLSTCILASPQPVVFAPAMNPTMWHSKATTRNVAILRGDGHYVVDPEPVTSVTSGDLDTGMAPSPVTLLPHLWHVRMRRLRTAYWPQATAQPPRTPAVAGAAGATLIPLKNVTVRPAASAPSDAAAPA